MPHPRSLKAPLIRGATNVFHVFVHHLAYFLGIVVVVSANQLSSGNWSVDLQAGASFGYRPMLFVILMAGLGAIVLQTLATRLGCVTGLDLASHCRLLLYNRTKRPRLVRIFVLYPLYVLSELAIISTDLAELLGSAIGFCLIFPKLPLWGGVMLTAADVLVFLAISDPYKGQGTPVRTFEFVIICLVLAVFVCFVILLVKAGPNWGQVFMGYIPDHTLLKSQPDAVYTAIGILGATVMPHALFLGSSLATQNRVSNIPDPADSVARAPAQGGFMASLQRRITSFRSLFKMSRSDQDREYHTTHAERENNSLTFIRQHLRHGVADVVTSLLLIAVPINSAILIIAAGVFYTGPEADFVDSVGLFDAHTLIQTRIGSGAALVFALALVCAGQTSSITVTLAGQLVSEGFIQWRFSPFLRRLITRLISLVPSMVVAIAVGRDGIDTLLVASQVILSIVLPFVAFPLIYLTSSEKIMRVRKTPLISKKEDVTEAPRKETPIPAPLSPTEITGDEDTIVDGPGLPPPVTQPRRSDDYVTVEPISSPMERELNEKPDNTVVSTSPTSSVAQKPKALIENEFISFRSSRLVTGLAYAIWSVVLVANVYAIAILVIRWSD
ncbi:hypothetical protein NP233_g623 [Leucocoprinus birnbaumii]|uniref:Natural resistance-associated macrophage protein n=1 Tax=Leucocoprinus birnbaumii TaxID=56174 RepID=A0AAD5Z048_9AGAR|nr:hypothetical protein NP233_g623 [Leucocoprinus birnbaumii]